MVAPLELRQPELRQLINSLPELEAGELSLRLDAALAIGQPTDLIAQEVRERLDEITRSEGPISVAGSIHFDSNDRKAIATLTACVDKAFGLDPETRLANRGGDVDLMETLCRERLKGSN